MKWIWTKESGQILPLTAALAVAFVLLLLGGVAVGEAFAAKNQAQAAANAGALAGDTVLLQTQDWNQAQPAAYAAAEKNGYSASDISASEVQTRSGSNAVQVKVQGSVSFVLTMPVSSTSEGTGLYRQIDPYSLLTLGRNSCSTTSNGSGDLTVNGGMFSDGGINKNGPGPITAGSIGVAPNGNGCNEDTDPEPQSGSLQSDPLSTWVVAPTQPVLGTETTSRSTDTYYPGFYPNGISENGSNTVVFEPGLYYVGGTGVSFNGSLTVSGSGLMFYFPPTGGGGLTVNGNVNVSLSAPTSPLYPGAPNGVVLWDAGSAYDTINGGNDVQLNGTFYAPKANLVVNGTSTANMLDGQVLTNSVTFNGHNDLTIGSSTSTWQATVSVPRLVTPGA